MEGAIFFGGLVIAVAIYYGAGLIANAISHSEIKFRFPDQIRVKHQDTNDGAST